MDVTEEYLANIIKYGASDYTGPASLVGSSSLNYAEGPTMQRAVRQKVTTAPYELIYQGDIGLMGVENIFFRIELDIQDTGFIQNCFEEPGFDCARVTDEYDLDMYYGRGNQANISFVSEGDEPIYDGAKISNWLPIEDGDTLVGVQLTNVGTDNMYENANVDARLYSICRFEHGYDDMLVGIKSEFYVGIHCRNTKRNAYNVKCKVGTEFKRPAELTSDEKRLLPHCP